MPICAPWRCMGQKRSAPLIENNDVGDEIICVWSKLSLLLFSLYVLISPCALFPYYTVSIDDAFATLTSVGAGHSFALIGMVGILVIKWRADEQNCVIKVARGGTLKSLWFPCERYYLWPWLGDAEIRTCSDMYQALGLQCPENLPPVPTMSWPVTSHCVTTKLKDIRGSYRKSWATIFCKVTCFIIDKPNTPP